MIGPIISLFPILFIGFGFIAIFRKNRKTGIKARTLCDSSEGPCSDSSSSSSDDKWLSPGGITTDYYSYSSQADDDFHRNHEY